MQPIQLTKANSDLNNQLEFLIRREFYVTYFKYRKFPMYLLTSTLLIIALSILTPADHLIALKAVTITLIAIAWLSALLFLAIIVIKRYKRNIWKEKTIKETFSNATNFQFSFDNEKLYFVTDNYNTDIKWDFYKYYAIDKGSIFIFPPNNIYEALYYSKNELGDANFESLKQIASTKLILLDDQNGTY